MGTRVPPTAAWAMPCTVQDPAEQYLCEKASHLSLYSYAIHNFSAPGVLFGEPSCATPVRPLAQPGQDV